MKLSQGTRLERLLRNRAPPYLVQFEDREAAWLQNISSSLSPPTSSAWHFT